MTVIRLRNPAAFDLPEIQSLFVRAFDHPNYPPPDGIVSELKTTLRNPGLIVLVAHEDHVYTSLAVMFLPATRLMDEPSVYHVYNEGSVGAKNRLVDAMVETLRENGYTSARTANQSAADPVFERVFRRAGTLTRLGSLYRVDFSTGG